MERHSRKNSDVKRRKRRSMSGGHRRPLSESKLALLDRSLVTLSLDLAINPISRDALRDQAVAWLNEDPARDITDWPGIPPLLLPFLRTLDLGRLAKLIEVAPWFYWHRLVLGQLSLGTC